MYEVIYCASYLSQVRKLAYMIISLRDVFPNEAERHSLISPQIWIIWVHSVCSRVFALFLLIFHEKNLFQWLKDRRNFPYFNYECSFMYFLYAVSEIFPSIVQYWTTLLLMMFGRQIFCPVDFIAIKCICFVLRYICVLL